MSRKRKVISIAVIGALLTGGGIAAALWGATGSGSGQAKALNAATVTVSAATGAADLYPGFTGGDVFFTLNNPNPYPVTFTSMTPGAITAGSGTCAASNISVIGATGLTITVPAGGTNVAASIADVVSMGAGALDGCQGATFSIALTLSGSQA